MDFVHGRDELHAKLWVEIVKFYPDKKPSPKGTLGVRLQIFVDTEKTDPLPRSALQEL